VTCKGCQGFIGPIPSAFLDKYLKNWRKGKGVNFKLPNIFCIIPAKVFMASPVASQALHRSGLYLTKPPVCCKYVSTGVAKNFS